MPGRYSAILGRPIPDSWEEAIRAQMEALPPMSDEQGRDLTRIARRSAARRASAQAREGANAFGQVGALVSPTQGATTDEGSGSMAQKVSIVLIDDIDGGEADETIGFALDGVAYEIDLNDVNADALRQALAPFIDSGRKVGRAGKPAIKGNGSGLSKADRDAIREWSRSAAAKKTGTEPLGDRGRIPANVIEAWKGTRRGA